MTTNPPTQTEPAARAGVIKLGLDVHLSSIVVVRQIDALAPQPAQRFTPQQFLIFARRQVERGAVVHSCYEAGPFGYTLHRQLSRLGINNLVVRPRDWSTYGERVKTDTRDAGALCSCLDRYLAGNRGALALVRVPSEQEEAARAESRMRDSLVRERIRLIVQGKSAARLRGYQLPANWYGPRIFVALDVPDDLRDQLAIWQRLLLSLQSEIGVITGRLKAAAPTQLPFGLGEVTWEIIAREVGDWHRFRNRRQVASYTGLCPGEHSSGGLRLQGSITRHGNPRLRHMLVEAAWRLCRHQPQYRVIAKWLPQMMAPKVTSARRKKIIVAIARELAIDLWRIGTFRATPSDLGLRVA